MAAALQSCHRVGGSKSFSACGVGFVDESEYIVNLTWVPRNVSSISSVIMAYRWLLLGSSYKYRYLMSLFPNLIRQRVNEVGKNTTPLTLLTLSIYAFAHSCLNLWDHRFRSCKQFNLLQYFTSVLSLVNYMSAASK